MKKNLFRTFYLLLALTMIVAIAACGGDSSTTPVPASPPPAEPSPAAPSPVDPGPAEPVDDYVPDASLSGILKVWYDNDDYSQEMFRMFNEIYPDITIEYQRISHTEARPQMQLDGPAGLGADVFFIPHDHLGNAMLDGLVEPIDSGLQQKLEQTQVASAVETVTFDGKMYAVPVTIENIALFYNKDLWGDTPPATMEEIIEFAKGYNDPAAGKWTMAWQVEDPYHNYHWLSVHGMEIFGPNHDDYKNPGFGSTGAVEGARYLRYLRENLLDVPSADSNWEFSVTRFQNGELPLTISGPWALADARNNGVNFGVAKIPTVNGKQPICFSGVRLAVMSSYTEVPELATAFLDFVSSVEGAGYFYGVEGMLPAFADQASVPGLSDDEYLMGIGQQTPYTVPMPIIPEVQAMWDGILHTFMFTWNGELSPEDGAARGMETYKLNLQAMGVDIDF